VLRQTVAGEVRICRGHFLSRKYGRSVVLDQRPPILLVDVELFGLNGRSAGRHHKNASGSGNKSQKPRSVMSGTASDRIAGPMPSVCVMRERMVAVRKDAFAEDQAIMYDPTGTSTGWICWGAVTCTVHHAARARRTPSQELRSGPVSTSRSRYAGIGLRFARVIRKAADLTYSIRGFRGVREVSAQSFTHCLAEVEISGQRR
jgi:hypothetical protein